MCLLDIFMHAPQRVLSEISMDNHHPALEEQDKSSDIEQQPTFGDRIISNIQPQNKGGGGCYKTNRNII